MGITPTPLAPSIMHSSKDLEYMHLALQEAHKAKNSDEVPVGAVLVKDDIVIASGYNRQITDNDPTAHAEIVALRKAGAVLQNYRLIDTTLYVTLEPCCMCLSALVHARVKRVVYATSDPKTGCLGGCINLCESECVNHSLEVTSGVHQGEASVLLTNFFKAKRKK